ncbi:lysyl oxidase -like protein [Labeo rohita]|uniref:Lysyl oxidase homolog n=1 Tax=Labeo rohita TaxID=84645 RepID=A0A498MRB4_LABRO|nr:lysyl oxidase -like protein [Labeo rohita]
MLALWSVSFVLLSIWRFSHAQYEHLGYHPGYEDPAQELYTAPELPEDIPKIQLRLAGEKRKHNEGRIEVFYEGEWGTVCDDDFTIHAAQVVCRELGYVEAVSWSPSSKYGKGEGRIWFDNVHCKGNEKSLAQCESNGIGVSDCKHTEDVGVVCSDKRIPGFKFVNTLTNNVNSLNIQVEDVRVRPILSSYRKRIPITEGYVEVKDGGKWKQICDDEWTHMNSRVICGMFGFPGDKRYNTRVYKMFARRRKATYWDYSINCTGNEAHLSSCKLGHTLAIKANSTCEQGTPVVVSCVPGRAFAPTPMAGFRKAFRQEKSVTECPFNMDKDSEGCSHEEDAGVRCNVPAMGFQQRLRLSGGRTPFEGRVEVLMEHNGSLVWGTVCGEGWGTMEAMVVCRQLGLGFASHAFQETWNWPGAVNADSVVMSGVRCAGTEMSLLHCLHHGDYLSCPRGGGRFAAGVSCSETAPDLVLNPQVVEQTTYLEDRPMFMLQCAYEENCLSSTSSSTPGNSYRRLLRFSSQIHNNGQSDFRPKASRETWVWHDCHRHYHSMEVFTHYDLLSNNGTKVAEGHKASFCLEDSECDEGIEKRYECANFGEQGITVGCWDTYRHDIDCQWVDITDVKPGDYTFQIVINPNYEVAESDYTNNIVKCRCRYDGHRIWMYNCHIGGSFSAETDTFPGLINNQVTHR